MKKVSAFMLAAAGLFLYSSCKKQDATEATTPPDRETITTEACGTKYLNLVVDPSGGGSYLYVVYNTPSNPPVTVNTINGSAGNNQIGSSSLATTVYKMTGLSFDPATSTCYGITGNGGSHPNSLITFNVGDPNVVTITPLFGFSTSAGIDLSDIERNPWNGRYYAIDRVGGRLVTIDVNTGQFTYLPNVLGFVPTGLAMDCNGKIYLMRMSGANGHVYVADPLSGSVILGPCAYPGVIAPGAFGNSEMGLHYDCDCTFNLVTGNFSGTGTVLTDGLPTCLGGPTYTAIAGGVKPTVDFSRLN